MKQNRRPSPSFKCHVILDSPNKIKFTDEIGYPLSNELKCVLYRELTYPNISHPNNNANGEFQVELLNVSKACIYVNSNTIKRY